MRRPSSLLLYRSPSTEILDWLEEPERFDFTRLPHPVFSAKPGIGDEAHVFRLGPSRSRRFPPTRRDLTSDPWTSSPIEKHLALQPILYAGSHFMYYSVLAVNT